MLKALRSLIIVALLIGIGAYGVNLAVSSRKSPEIKKQAEPVLAVRILSPSASEQRPVLFVIGKVEARDYTTLTMPIEANILKIEAREGEFFAAGKRLLFLDQRELEYTARQQQAELDRLRAQLSSVFRNRRADSERMEQMHRLLELATTEHQRDKSLYEKGVLSLTQLEASEKNMVQQEINLSAIQNQVADYETQQAGLQAQLDAGVAQLAQTELLIERSEMRAPFAGRVAKVHTVVGARPARGLPLVEIFDPSRLYLRVTVPQRHIDAFKGGNDVRLLLERAGATDVTLSFSRLEPQVESGGSGIDALFLLPRGDWVLGSVYDVVLQLPPLSALVLPVNAIYNDRFVYRVGADSRAEAFECRRLGVVRGETDVDILADCPDIGENARIVANQLPNLLNGAKLRVIGEDGESAESANGTESDFSPAEAPATE